MSYLTSIIFQVLKLKIYYNLNFLMSTNINLLIIENFPFYRLMAFQKYFINEDARNYRSAEKCSQITSLSDCSGNDRKKLCNNTRKCPGRLIGCHEFQNRGETSYLCVSYSEFSDKNDF